MAPHKVLGVIIVLPEVLGAGAEPLGVATEEEGVGWTGERVGVSLTIHCIPKYCDISLTKKKF